MEEKNPEIIAIHKLVRDDSENRPYTVDKIQRFCDYIYENPISKNIDAYHRVPVSKIRAAKDLYQHTKEENQKKMLLDLLMAMFEGIQTARDALGVDPFDPEEGYLHFDNSPPEPEKAYKDLGEKMMDKQIRMNEAMARCNDVHLKIDALVFIHGYLHRMITEDLKIPLPNISFDLKRSPEEKARTKDMLEKKAAAMGRKKPEPKVPEQPADP